MLINNNFLEYKAGAMVFHAALWMTAFADTVAQAPVILQCQQTGPDPQWKWFIQTVVPIAGGVLIAWIAFRWNSRKEHEQWIRDQKKAEWRELLRSAAEMQRVLRMETMTRDERAREIADKLKPAAHELSIASSSCVFLHDFFSDAENRAKFYGFLQGADEASGCIDGLLSLHSSPLPGATQQERSHTAASLMQEVDRITTEYLTFCDWLRKEAAKSVGMLRN